MCGDSADLYAALRIDGQPVSPDQIQSVVFNVQLPDGSTATVNDGIILDDGQGFYRWTSTSEAGVYLVQAQFTLVTGEIRSVMTNFSVVNPFADSPEPTYEELITGQVWLRLEDVFDSIAGGPWLRDMTLYNFDENKIAAFIPEALLDINVEMPPTNFSINDFCMQLNTPGDNPNMPLLVKGTLCLTVRHLMRSYVEQPHPQGAQVVWQDRTTYTQMWSQIYQFESQDFISKLRLWKRTTLNLGQSSLSIFSKQGRQGGFYGTNQAARSIYRGFY